MEGKQSSGESEWTGCVMLLLVPFAVGVFWFLMPKIDEILNAYLSSRLTIRFVSTAIRLSSLFLTFFIFYRLEEWGALPDERSGFLRFIASETSANILLWLWAGVVLNVLLGFGEIGHDQIVSTLRSGDGIAWTGTTYILSYPQRGDLVVTRGSLSDEREWVWTGRIVGLPEEQLELMNGQIVVDGQPLKESYLGVRTCRTCKSDPFLLASNEYFVASDYRIVGETFGIIVEREEIIGKIFLRSWPPSRFAFLPGARYSDYVPSEGLQTTETRPPAAIGWPDKWRVPTVIGSIVLVTVVGTAFVFGVSATLTFFSERWPVLACVGIGLALYWYWLWPFLLARTSGLGRWSLGGIWILSAVITVALSDKEQKTPALGVIFWLTALTALLPFVPFAVIYLTLEHINERFLEKWFEQMHERWLLRRGIRDESKSQNLIELGRMYAERGELQLARSTWITARSTADSEETRKTAEILLAQLRAQKTMTPSRQIVRGGTVSQAYLKIDANTVQGHLININTATVEELMSLSGIGPVTAHSIVHYRETYGPFGSIDKVTHVSGVGDATFERIKDRIVVSPQHSVSGSGS